MGWFRGLCGEDAVGRVQVLTVDNKFVGVHVATLEAMSDWNIRANGLCVMLWTSASGDSLLPIGRGIRCAFCVRLLVRGSVSVVTSRWSYGEMIVRREISWGGPSQAMLAFVVEDSDSQLAIYVPTHAPFAFGDVRWPTADGRHPWWPNQHWQGHGCLMLQRPGEAYAVWHMWGGDDRHFEAWYINLQEPFRRTAIGIDTQDFELDVIVLPSGEWFFKDEEVVEQSVRNGRYSDETGSQIRSLGQEIAAMLDRNDAWWDEAWTAWTPDQSWSVPDAVDDGWHLVPWTNDR